VQTLPSVLPQSSGIYFTPTMTEHIASIVIAAATIMGIGTQVTIHQLDEATAKQCINHEWPVEHMTSTLRGAQLTTTNQLIRKRLGGEAPQLLPTWHLNKPVLVTTSLLRRL
jgi:hypothetical protein